MDEFFLTPSLQNVQDLIPFFMCMEGDFTSALQSLLSSVNSPASRFTPNLFLIYFRIFESATAPKLVVSQPAELCNSDAEWKPIKSQTWMHYNVFTCNLFFFFF